MPSLNGLLFPESQLTLTTLLPPEEAAARLLAATVKRPDRWYFRRRRAGQRFLGGPSAQHAGELLLERLVPYPDPWRPLLRVRLAPKGSGAELTVSLTLSPLGRRVTIAWHALALIVGGGALLAVLTGTILPRGLILTGLSALYAALPALDQRVERGATLDALEEVLNKGGGKAT